MAEVIGRFKKGKITVSIIRGEFEGKPSTSFTIKKRVLKNNQWSDSDFYTITDLLDVQAILGKAISNYVKFEKVEPKPKPKEPEEGENPYEEETPF